MINETIILLTYYYDHKDADNKILRHIIKNYSPAYLPWEIYLSGPLRKFFSRVVVYDYLKRRAEVGIETMNREIIELVRKERPKYVLWTSFYYDVYQTTLDTIRKQGAKVVGWFFDDEWRFDSYSRWWIPYLDYVVTNAIGRVEDYKRLGANVIQTVPNTGIAVARDWAQKTEKYAVSFVGSRFYSDRRMWIDELVKRNIEVSFFGEGWSGYIPFEEMLEYFWSSKINLNFSKGGHQHPVRQIKGRVFQTCLAGGFMLTEYSPGIENYFEIGKEIDCFENTAQMLEKISYYLPREEERRAIAQAGWQRATRAYSSNDMVARVFDEIKKDVRDVGIAKNRVNWQGKIVAMKRCALAEQYHLNWGKALIEEGSTKSLWEESLSSSISYSRFGISARCYRKISRAPLFLRPALFRVISLITEPTQIIRKASSVVNTIRFKVQHERTQSK